MSQVDAWLWLDFEGPQAALERLVAELQPSGLSGAEERPDGQLRVYWPAAAGAEAVLDEARRLARRCGVTTATSGLEPRADWLREWKRFFQPLKVTERLWVTPPWEQVDEAAGEAVIVIDQKRAFGTGHHATTRLCLEWLEERLPPGASYLDVGCGGGILAIAALKLGAAAVAAIDDDPDAIAEATANLELNGLAGSARLSCGEFGRSDPETADYVTCNVLLSRLLPMLPQLLAAARSGLCLAGFELSERRELDAALSRLGVEPVWERAREGWGALAIECAGRGTGSRRSGPEC